VPALHIGAWYDYFEEGPVRNFLGIRAKGGSEAARKGQRLLMIVGGHAGAGPKVGDVDFGKESVVDIGALALRWYDYVMKGIDNGMAAEKPVKLFLMGRNTWVEAADWPVPGTTSVRYYLHSAGKANSLAGDGLLSTALPGAEPEDRFVYDPSDPVPTTGGPAFGDVHLKPGPCDQRDVEKRADVLVYTTPALDRDTQVVGPVSLDLHVGSSAVDTDFTGKLVDVSPDGAAINLTEGILRARYRASREKAVLMKPGETC
jgi:putative CocE/NonD family hydrolase